MTSIRTLNPQSIELYAVLGGVHDVVIDVHKYDYGVCIHVSTQGLNRLTVNEAIGLNNALQKAINIANEFDYCVEKYQREACT